MCNLLSEGGRCNACALHACSDKLAVAVRHLDAFVTKVQAVPAAMSGELPHRRRRRFRELLVALRGALTRSSTNRRELMVFGLGPGEREDEMHAACDRVDSAEQNLQLEEVAQTQDGDELFGKKGALALEAEQCDAERCDAAVELNKIRLAWTPRDNKVVDGATGKRTKAFDRRVYLEGLPPGGKFEMQYVGGPAQRGHLGMLNTRAETARRLANEQPTNAERAARVAAARVEMAAATADLEHLRTH